MHIPNDTDYLHHGETPGWRRPYLLALAGLGGYLAIILLTAALR